jgi:hypothetical protein
MGAPKKLKSAGVRKEKTKGAAAKSSPATAMEPKAREAATESPAVTKSPAANGTGNGAATAEMIRLRAFEIFMTRDSLSGDELSDWLAAEREIMGTPSSYS